MWRANTKNGANRPAFSHSRTGAPPLPWLFFFSVSFTSSLFHFFSTSTPTLCLFFSSPSSFLLPFFFFGLSAYFSNNFYSPGTDLPVHFFTCSNRFESFETKITRHIMRHRLARHLAEQLDVLLYCTDHWSFFPPRSLSLSRQSLGGLRMEKDTLLEGWSTQY